jgi:hypothetical protein
MARMALPKSVKRITAQIAPDKLTAKTNIKTKATTKG